MIQTLLLKTTEKQRQYLKLEWHQLSSFKTMIAVTQKHTHSALAVRVEKYEHLPSCNRGTEKSRTNQAFAFLVPHNTNFHQFGSIFV